jgi:alkanesulfonate monooxygenase SsuD/methylene tetrahydromethanopterin reductase-like flavin-dependent oxidoreductase (luciferase family)
VLNRINRDRGILGPLAAPDDAAKVLQSADQDYIAKIRRDSFAGTGPEVMARIVELKERVGVDEMAVVTWTYDEAIRRQSYTELAKAF